MMNDFIVKALIILIILGNVLSMFYFAIKYFLVAWSD